MIKRAILLATMVGIGALMASAQRLTAVSVAYTDILDTYLSQEKFTGTEISFLSQRTRMSDSSRVSRELIHHASVTMAGTRGNDHSLLSALYNLRFGWHYNWTFPAQRLHLRVGGAGDMPLVGIAFSPNYGQSYYEIFSRGNYDHNVVFVSPLSGPQLHQMLTLDVRLWRTTLTVGYLCDILQMEANDLKYHQYSHGILIGWRY